MKITTKTGDKGKTYSLKHKSQIPKNDDEFEYYGKVDELLAWIAMLYEVADSNLQNQLNLIIKAVHKSYALLFSKDIPKELTFAIEIMEKFIGKVENQTQFDDFLMEVFYSKISIYANMCRVKAREVERAAVRLKLERSYAFWNRMSDYFFAVVMFYESNKKTYKDL